MKTVLPIGTEYFAKLRANYWFNHFSCGMNDA